MQLIKPTIKEQIEWLRNKMFEIEHTANDERLKDQTRLDLNLQIVMIREILENLIAVKLWNKVMDIEKPVGPYLKWVLIEANNFFFDTIANMKCIVSTESFIELKHDERQIYLRLPVGVIEPGEVFKMYIEPQINMSRSQRMGNASIKIQLSCLRFKESRYSSPVTSKMKSTDFIHYLNMCEEWNYKIDSLLVDEPELNFDKAQESNLN
jgi:hypothetical protein